jgi:hypothetical protein
MGESSKTTELAASAWNTGECGRFEWCHPDAGEPAFHWDLRDPDARLGADVHDVAPLRVADDLGVVPGDVLILENEIVLKGAAMRSVPLLIS